MKRKISIKGLKRKVWKEISTFIRNRDPICVTCKKKPTTEAGHYIHNNDKATQSLIGNKLWYDLRNLNGQCSYCNRWLSGKLDKYAEYLEEKYGFGVLQELRIKFNTHKKWTKEELELIIKKYL